MARSETVRAHVKAIHSSGGATFVEEPVGCGVFHWKTRLGKWPFEMQVDRFVLEVRCYLADELFCTGRLPDEEADDLIEPATGPGDPTALAALEAFVEGSLRTDSRRFLKPPHADRHPDRRADARQDATIRQKPERRVDLPA
jgi:hypothetical protein